MSAGCRLGILLPMVGHGLSAGELLTELTEEVRVAEDVGLDVVLVPEHHAGPPGSLTAPLTVVAWLLARTSRIHIGTGVLILPLHSTVQVAEEAALLQEASGGRLVLGVGAGYQAADFELYGRARAGRAARLEAAMSDLRAMWSGQPVTGAPVRPSLAGAGAPPLWLGAWSEAGVRRAATHADGWTADPIRTMSEVATMASAYRSAARAAGGGEGHVVVLREGFVAGTREAALAAYAPAAAVVYRYYLRHGAFPPESGVTEADITSGAAMDDRLVAGSPEEVAAQISSIVEQSGAETVVLALRHPTGPSHEDVVEAIRLLGTRVAPLLAEAARPGPTSP